jgi:hypothetical protein
MLSTLDGAPSLVSMADFVIPGEMPSTGSPLLPENRANPGFSKQMQGGGRAIYPDVDEGGTKINLPL